MRREIRFCVALIMVVGGGLWLLYQLFIADYLVDRLIIAACVMVGTGGYWLWDHWINPTPNREDD
jgi:hypothetical protein